MWRDQATLREGEALSRKLRPLQAGTGGRGRRWEERAEGGAGKGGRGAARGGPGAGAQGGPFPPGSRTDGRETKRRPSAWRLRSRRALAPFSAGNSLDLSPGRAGRPGVARASSGCGPGCPARALGRYRRRRPRASGRAASRSSLGLSGRSRTLWKLGRPPRRFLRKLFPSF